MVAAAVTILPVVAAICLATELTFTAVNAVVPAVTPERADDAVASAADCAALALVVASDAAAVIAADSAASASALANAVVAICVVLVFAAAVGAVGVPVKSGEASGAFVPRAVVIVVV